MSELLNNDFENYSKINNKCITTIKEICESNRNVKNWMVIGATLKNLCIEIRVGAGYEEDNETLKWLIGKIFDSFLGKHDTQIRSGYNQLIVTVFY